MHSFIAWSVGAATLTFHKRWFDLDALLRVCSGFLELLRFREADASIRVVDVILRVQLDSLGEEIKDNGPSNLSSTSVYSLMAVSKSFFA